MIEDSQDKCPNCGAPNANVKRTVEHTPKTIEELKAWYEARNLPPYETTRFFIGIDYKEPKAFGIYQDGSEFVVYKNKGDGSRAVRYRGTDEAYAVNEIYLKLKSEILNQKAQNVRSGGGGSSSSYRRRAKTPSDLVERTEGNKFKTAIAVFFGLMGIGMVGLLKYRIVLSIILFVALVAAVCGITKLLVMQHKKNTGGDAFDFVNAHPELSKWLYFSWTDCIGLNRTTFVLLFITMLVSGQCFAVYTTPHYYSPENSDAVYVNYHDDWYEYDDVSDSYNSINFDALPTEIQTNPADYEFNWTGAEWNPTTEFKDSSTYESNYKSSDSWDWGSSDSDSDYDWDSGSDSWDSGGSDWDSDW